MPLYFVSALAREHVKVVLTGEGSDELLAGYGKYPRALVNWRAGAVYERMVPASRCATSIAARVVPRLPGGLARYARRSFLAMPRTPEAMFFDNFAAIRLRAPGGAARAAARAARDARDAYGASLALLRRAERQQHDCSIACSTPTSRPIWSSC